MAPDVVIPGEDDPLGCFGGLALLLRGSGPQHPWYALLSPLIRESQGNTSRRASESLKDSGISVLEAKGSNLKGN